MGDKGRQDFGKADTPSNKEKHTMGDKTSGGRTHHLTQAHMRGDNGRRGETRPREGVATQHRQTCRETRGDKTSGRPAPLPTHAHMWGDHWGQW